ncbi:PadR family transcriptional regulator [Tsukamurella sp. 8F]|uniref:PadR family transcriptional regulator n=1 Tax=unclassified Tsukamurella TaxID=2633480 RepID=UPI0023B9E164|nr:MULTISPECIES: PadR family transcriptional regulator [unclassified Tsukamurella]MDF0531066.1 PadR family transcriptional regulator [Tsukamurella sp. 8J]MDF0585467.1 PadR family transcriptional regulator [Tsukamurella sp. 8F]
MDLRLTPTSYIVLGLVRWEPGSTAYELERRIGATVSHMWTIQRSQIYREPLRLAEAGLLTAESDDAVRAKTRFSITDAGSAAMDSWLSQASGDMPQLRDLSILKIFFGATPEDIARVQLLAHQARLKEYEYLREAGGIAHEGPRRALDAAIAHERTSIRYWSDLVKPAQ